MHVHGVYMLCCIVTYARLSDVVYATSMSEDNEINNIEQDYTQVNHQHTSGNGETFKFETENNRVTWYYTSRLLDLARSVSLTSLDNIQYIAYRILLIYNNMLNIYSKRARTLSNHMKSTENQLNNLEQDLDGLIEDLYEKYETSDTDTKPTVKQLLDIALLERDRITSKVSEYSILECRTVMGRSCTTDDDCYGKGCLLQCKTSGHLWWTDSVCR